MVWPTGAFALPGGEVYLAPISRVCSGDGIRVAKGDQRSVPRTIANRYELEGSSIGVGAMGEVWRGHDLHLDRPVAVKFIRFPDGRPDDELIRRFEVSRRIADLTEPERPRRWHPY
jgi:hypothetical protein